MTGYIPTPLERFRSRLGTAKGYSHCLCCHRTWNIAEGHTTPYSESKRCFPLCVDCWPLMSIEERLPYYEALMDIWESQLLSHNDSIEEERVAVLAAVREGL